MNLLILLTDLGSIILKSLRCHTVLTERWNFLYRITLTLERYCNYRILFCRIVMRNFLRIRNGDRFWYERYLSEEVNKRLFSCTNIILYKSRLVNFTIKIKCIFKCRMFEADTYKELIRLGNTAVSADLTKNKKNN